MPPEIHSYTNPQLVTIAKSLRNLATELREHPEHHTKHLSARDKYGAETLADTDKAVCWCAYGFLTREFTKDFDLYLLASDLVRELNEERGGGPYLAAWNDMPERTASEVAELFDAGAETLETVVRARELV